MDETASAPVYARPGLRFSPLGQTVGLVVAIGVCLGVGGIGGLFTSSSVDTWYPTLDKPAFTPSGAVIGAVWTFLYVLMGIAAWRIWRKAGLADAKRPLTLFGVQLALNLGWSIVFFGLESPGWALVEIAALFLAILATARSFHRVDAWAAYLLVPYLAWVAFASALNAAIWWLN